MSLSDLLMLIVLFLIGYFFWLSAKAKENANLLVKHHCDTQDLQVLDGSVVFKSFGLQRDQASLLKLSRQYVFEFSSTGVERYQGKVIIQGKSILSIDLGVYRIAD